MKIRSTIAYMLILCVSGAASAAVDQSQTKTPWDWESGGAPTHEAQVFTVGAAGLLDGVDLRIFSPVETGSVVIDIRNTVGGVPVADGSPTLSQISVPFSQIDSSYTTSPNTLSHFSMPPIPVVPGEVLAIAVHNVNPSNGGYILSGNNVSYPGGSVFGGFYGNTWGSGSSTSALGFQTYVDVPEPAAMSLVGVSLAGFLARRVRRRRA